LVLRFGILTASDRAARGERPDLSGPALGDLVRSQSWKVVHTLILPDERPLISQTLADWADGGELDVLLVTGGTGFAPRDVTPEATRQVLDREAPGLEEAMRTASLKLTPHGMLSRGVAGIRGRVLIVDLPGSPRAAVDNLQVILPVLAHAVELIQESPEAEEYHGS
jgi:molybdenum cofactor synthesis domain-containing protein